MPGSTLKPITIAAAIETSAITSNQVFECGPKARQYGSEELHDASAHHSLDVAHLLAVSSNIGTSHIFDALGGEHFALAHALPLRRGAEARRGNHRGISHRDDDRHVQGGSGGDRRGDDGNSTQMAAAYAAIASDGVYHAPTTARAASPGERLVSSSTASQVMAMLDTAVTDETATGSLPASRDARRRQDRHHRDPRR